MKLTILGCHAATPRTFTNPTAQVLEISGRLFLIDCGEGTQVQLRRNKVRFMRINHVFISHLHGDHLYGLIGLVSTFMLLGRATDLHIHGPKGIKEIITLQLRLGQAWTQYRLYFHELESDQPEIVFEDEKVTVTSVPLSHRIYTNGFVFREKRGLRKLNIEAAESFGIDKCYYRNIVLGKDVTSNSGQLISNDLVTFEPVPPKSYAFCSDTVFDPGIVPHIQGVDVLYHESTFLEREQALAARTMHATARQAAQIAKLADVGTLVLGHYSTRYDSVADFGTEAAEIFPNVVLSQDGKTFEF